MLMRCSSAQSLRGASTGCDESVKGSLYTGGLLTIRNYGGQGPASDSPYPFSSGLSNGSVLEKKSTFFPMAPAPQGAFFWLIAVQADFETKSVSIYHHLAFLRASEVFI